MNYKKTVRIMTYHHSYTHLASHLPQSYVIPVRSRLARACHVALGQGGRERVCSTTHSDKKSWKSQRKTSYASAVGSDIYVKCRITVGSTTGEIKDMFSFQKISRFSVISNFWTHIKH